MQQAVALWCGRGFRVLFERVRMQRPRDLTPPVAMASDVRLARLEDQSVLETLMDGYYDKVLGCLPERDELAADIRRRRGVVRRRAEMDRSSECCIWRWAGRALRCATLW